MEERFKPPFKRDAREEFEEKHLAGYAVRSVDATRLYNDGYKKCDFRTEFQRDRDRIIHSRAFKRLMDKTQVYMTLQGDHYRNRLSHTLEVAQIARSIASCLGLNPDLVEAIALGHDLGHTPFGHAVEDIIHDLLPEDGFKHNYQGVMVVDILESKDFKESPYGLNLTNHTRYGILNHTKTDKIIPIYNLAKDNLVSSNKYKSIESDLVGKVDTLTYLYHDLDDAIKNKNIFDDMRTNDKKTFEKFHKELNRILKIAHETSGLPFKDIKFSLDDYSSSVLLKTMIEDLISGTSKNINKHNINSLEQVRICSEKIVEFETFEKTFFDLKDCLKEYVYSSPLANQMDTKAKYIVHKLFDSFMNNPKQLPYRTRELYEKSKSKEEDICRLDSGYRLTPKRVICNYISGMTDRYALENYKRMFEA